MAGASLMPSPTMATRRPLHFSRVICAAFSSGFTSKRIFSTPHSPAMRLAVSSLSPEIIQTSSPNALQASTAFFASSRSGSLIPGSTMPSVRVPVLSKTTVSMLHAFSIAEAPLKRIPSSAARPEAVIKAAGVASPSAQGQAITSTPQTVETAFPQSPGASRKNHSAKISTASTITDGTKTEAIRSANRCTGAFSLCARRTKAAICRRVEFSPTEVAVYVTLPSRSSVPPVMLSPGFFCTGSLSPVSSDSSTRQLPSRIFPSAGMRSPGRSRIVSPETISAASISTSIPSRSTIAVLG